MTQRIVKIVSIAGGNAALAEGIDYDVSIQSMPNLADHNALRHFVRTNELITDFVKDDDNAYNDESETDDDREEYFFHQFFIINNSTILVKYKIFN